MGSWGTQLPQLGYRAQSELGTSEPIGLALSFQVPPFSKKTETRSVG